MKKVNVLSVDFDYFIPDLSDFDWGADETRAFFFEHIWALRAGNHGICTGKRAVDVLHADNGLLNAFWTGFEDAFKKARKRVIRDGICICESHRNIVDFMDSLALKNVAVWNFDQHHDVQYQNKQLDCGNWVYHLAKRGTLIEYNLIYPPWRKKNFEQGKTGDELIKDLQSILGNHVKINIYMEQPEIPAFNYVFLCRSPQWVPSWCDMSWNMFYHRMLFKSGSRCKMLSSETHTKIRHPNYAEAVKCADDFDALIEKTRKKAASKGKKNVKKTK